MLCAVLVKGRRRLRNTFSIFIISTIPQLILALIAAVLDQNLRTKTFWRMGCSCCSS